MTKEKTEEQMSIADLGLWFGKTSSELCPREIPEAKTSESSLKNASELSTPMPLFLDLRTWNGQTWGAFWETDSPSLGEYTTRSFGEFPNVVVESRLSQILEVTPPPRYCLSAKACQGILKRAEKRGKILPEILKTALEKQSHFKNDSDDLGGGKGILIQNETVGTLSSVFNLHKVVYDASRRHNYEPFGEVAGTVQAHFGTGGGNVPIVTEPQSFDCRGKGKGSVTQSLTGDHARRVSDYTPLIIEEPTTFRGDSITSPTNKSSSKPGDPCHTLTDDSRNYVVEHKGFDAYNQKLTGDVAMTISGAAQDAHHIPTVIEQKVFGISPFDSNAMKSSNPTAGIYEAETSKTLDLNGGNPACNQGGTAVVMNENHYGEYIEADQTATIRRNGGTCGGGLNPLLYQETIGTLCKSDAKGIGNQYVNNDKVIVQYLPES